MLRRILWNPEWNKTLFLVNSSERLIAAPTQHSQQEIRRRIMRDLMHSTRHPRPQPYCIFDCFLDRVGPDLIKSVEYETGDVEISKGVQS